MVLPVYTNGSTRVALDWNIFRQTMVSTLQVLFDLCSHITHPALEDWFCHRCIARKTGKLSHQPDLKSWSSRGDIRRPSPRPQLTINSSRKVLPGPPTPSPDFQPWSAPLPVLSPRATSDHSETECTTDQRVTSDTYHSKSSNHTRLKSKQPAWTEHEEDALIAVMGELVAEGSAIGEARWELARVRLRERGVHRSAAATKMAWMRGLRERSGIDERRHKKMESLTTGLQRKKKVCNTELKVVRDRRGSM